MAKNKSEFVKNIKMTKPNSMEYYTDISTPKARRKFIERVKKIVRSSMEYRDYIQFLKENVGLDSCVFWKNVTGGDKHKRISIQMHHEPFTLEDYVNVVLTKYEEEGLPLNDLLIADEVLELHYENLVGLVPVSKTAHQLIHNTEKLFVPLNMVYGNYAEFLEKYDPYIEKLYEAYDVDLYAKLERKMDMTANLTDETFEAIKKQFTYLDVDGVEDVEKVDLEDYSGNMVAS